MAKKDKDSAEKPKVTQIPLPISDSALVIDLPDGQKLVVGKMNHGTVIEVATWRGTGRPDSRTNRMMLGMSNTEIEAQIQEEEARQSKEKSNDWKTSLQTVKGFAVSGALKIKRIFIKLKTKIYAKQTRDRYESKFSHFKESSSAPKKDAQRTPDDDIQAWLDRVTSKAVTDKSRTASVKKKAVNQKPRSKKATQRRK